MKVNLNCLKSGSFMGQCSIGKDMVQKIIIADKIINVNKPVCEEAAKALKDIADSIAEITPDEAKLYVDYTNYPVSYPYGTRSHGYEHKVSVYLKDGENDEYKCIASNSTDSCERSYITLTKYFNTIKESLLNTVHGHYQNPPEGRIYHHKQNPTEKECKPILDIIS